MTLKVTMGCEVRQRELIRQVLDSLDTLFQCNASLMFADKGADLGARHWDKLKELRAQIENARRHNGDSAELAVVAPPDEGLKRGNVLLSTELVEVAVDADELRRALKAFEVDQ